MWNTGVELFVKMCQRKSFFLISVYGTAEAEAVFVYTSQLKSMFEKVYIIEYHIEKHLRNPLSSWSVTGKKQT